MKGKVTSFLCKNPECKHAYYRHKESTEWQLLNRPTNEKGCTVPNCTCKEAK